MRHIPTWIWGWDGTSNNLENFLDNKKQEELNILNVSTQNEKNNTSTEAFIYLEESKQLAKKLYDNYKEKIYANYEKDIDNFGDIRIPWYQQSTSSYLDKVPDEIKKHYQGHWIRPQRNAIDDEDVIELSVVLNIMANKCIKGSSASFSSDKTPITPWIMPFLIVSKKDKELLFDDRDFELQHHAMKADIGAIIVDVKYYPLVDELKKMFPDINIIKANQLQNYFK